MASAASSGKKANRKAGKTANTARKSSGKGTRTASSAGKNTRTERKGKKKTIDEINAYQDYQAFEFGITIFVIAILSIFLYLSYFGLTGKAGVVIGGFAFGIFGWFAWFFPLFCLIGFVFSVVNSGDRRIYRRIFSFLGIVLSLLALFDLLFQRQIITEYYTSNHVLHRNYFECMYLTCQNVVTRGKLSGGLLGRAVSALFSKIIGEVGACVILFALLLFCLYLFYGLEWMGRLRKRNAYRREMEEISVQVRDEEEYQKPSYRIFQGNPAEKGRKSAERSYGPQERQITGKQGTRRELQKAPKIQMFDLQELNERIDRMEHTMAEQGMVPEKQSDNQSDNLQESVQKLDQIPIYRNELNEKFGNKKNEKKAIPKEPVPVEPPVPAKPMASFAHKEEVTDVTPSVQKAAMAKESLHKEQKPLSGRKESMGQATDGKMEGMKQTSAVQKAGETAKEEKPYEFPPITLLSLPQKKDSRQSDSELRLTASKLQDTLKSFHVNVQMGAVTCGPTVTRYELLPEQGVRVNKITNLADDLKLSLAAPSIRIEAPIPGKAAVGVEVPNPSPDSVFFRELLEEENFKKAKSALTFAVGKDIAGKLILADITKMPHLLIAGATGSGKSVCINTLIMSILYKADPNDVKLIMIDPKVVELSVYNGIPHLFCPVVTDPKEAAAALNWAVREMMERYNKFKELGVRSIAGYNEKVMQAGNTETSGYTKMPYLVVVVDEFADLMMVASKEVEDAVCRLAQLARAAGIHLVLATQRPSVNVITGVIKANIPSRIAFSVSSLIDSRTILDKGGAEKLLGKGDMLFFPSGYSEPVRVQGAFISDKEVSDVVNFLCDNNETPEYNHDVTEMVNLPPEENDAKEKKPQEERDEYFEDAGRFVIESERAAAGQLQRRFSIGFNRAGRIIDQLHKAGVVGPAEGTKPRKVLLTMEEFEQMLSGKDDSVSQEEMESMVKEMEESAVTDEILS